MQKMQQIKIHAHANADTNTNKKKLIKITNQGEEIKMSSRTPCEKFSRSMGFIRAVSNFNIGKYSEFCERKTFTEANCLSAGQRHHDLLKKAA